MTLRVNCRDLCADPISMPPFPPGWGGTTPPVDPTILAVICPTIPSTAVVNTPTTIRVIGQNFTADCKAFLDNVQQATTFVSATELTFQATGTVAKTSTITVKDIVANTTATGTCQFVWTAAAILTIVCPVAPASAVCGSAALQVDVNGTLFTPTTIVTLDGVDQVTTYVSATRVNFQINPVPELTPRTAIIGVKDGANTAVATCPFDFTIIVLQPTITLISPDMVGRNDPAQIITVTGTNFVDGESTIMRGGLAIPTTFVNATTLQGSTDPATAVTGLFEMRVKNGTGPTAKISNPIEGMCVGNPTMGSLVPNTAPAGSAALTCTVYGTNYGDTAKVLVDGNEVTTTRVNSGVLTFQMNPVGAAPASVQQVSVRLGHQHGPLHDDITPSAPPLTLPFTFT